MIWLYFIQLFRLHHVIHLFQFIFSKSKLLMTKESSKAPPLYPKTHLLAASGIAALLSLALLVFPSSDVEAKKTTLSHKIKTPPTSSKPQMSRQPPLSRRSKTAPKTLRKPPRPPPRQSSKKRRRQATGK
jgi:hypothetical protein